MSFKRLVRFVDENGQTLYGDLGDTVPSADVTGSTVVVLDGNLETGWRQSGRQATITKVRSHNTN
jgi:transcription initiation factor TFIIH subunit 2